MSDTNTIRVLLFGVLAQKVGTRELSLACRENLRVGDAIAQLSDDHPAIAGASKTLAFAVNESYAHPSMVLRAGDILALIPPVSGG